MPILTRKKYKQKLRDMFEEGKRAAGIYSNGQIVCFACSCKFYPVQERMYFIREYDARYVGVYKRYMAIDCPSCGAQVRLGVRLPRENEQKDF